MNKFENIKSDRLVLRSMDLMDATAIFRYRSNANDNQYQGFIPEKLEEVQDFIEHKIAKEFNQINTWYQLAIVLEEPNELIGDLGLHFMENEAVEIGCTIAKEHQGKSYATEALNRAIEYLFTDMKKQRIIGSVDPQNKASIAMLEKLGFQLTAHHKKSFQLRGEWVDDMIFGLSIDDFLLSQRR